MFRLAKVFFVGLVSLFAVITCLSLLIPSSVKVSRVVTINDTVTNVYAQVVDFHNWHNWHPVFASKEATVSYSGKDCEIAYNNTKAKMIFQSVDSLSVKFLLAADGENDISNQISIQSLPKQKVTQVEWQAITKLHWYPWEKFYGIFIDKLSGPGYDAALDGLKKYMETAH